MRTILILFLFLAGCSGNFSKCPLSTVTITDRNGFQETVSTEDRLEKYENVDFLSPQPYETVMRVYKRDEQGNIPAVLTSYHENGQIKQYLEVVNGRARGSYREWHPNGVLGLQTTVLEGEATFDSSGQQGWVFDGISEVWDEEGNRIAEIPYEKGRLEGVSSYYHPSGTLWKSTPFVKGIPEGKSTTYLEDGSLLQEISYANGKRQGKLIRYWNNDQIASEENYDNGLLLSGSYFSKEGQPISQIRFGEGHKAIFGKDRVIELHEYQDGFPEGVVRILAEDGTDKQIFHIKNGVKEGDDIEFYPDSKGKVPRISTHWINGEIHGVVKTWYPSGTLESQREVQGDKKQGVLSAWYKNGSLMMVEEYDKDLLVRGKYYKLDERSPISSVEEGEGIATLYDSSGSFIAKVKYKSGKPVL